MEKGATVGAKDISSLRSRGGGEVGQYMILLASYFLGGVLALVSLSELARLLSHGDVAGGISNDSSVEPGDSLMGTMILLAWANIAFSVSLVIAYYLKRHWAIYLVRLAFVWSILLLGLLVAATGGPPSSAYFTLFAAILPLVVLIKDSHEWRALHAVLFLSLFFVGRAGVPALELEDTPKLQHFKDFWTTVFFLLFVSFPLSYSTMAGLLDDRRQSGC